MAMLFDHKDLKIPKQEPLPVLEKIYTEVLVEIMVAVLIIVAFWKIARALKLF